MRLPQLHNLLSRPVAKPVSKETLESDCEKGPFFEDLEDSSILLLIVTLWICIYVPGSTSMFALERNSSTRSESTPILGEIDFSGLLDKKSS